MQGVIDCSLGSSSLDPSGNRIPGRRDR